MTDHLTEYYAGLADGIEQERTRQHQHDWRKLFLYIYGGSFLAFATVYLLVTWL